MTIDLKAIPSLYDITGDIKDINTMLVPKQMLEAAEKDAARKVIRVKLGDQYGNDLNGHWFYLHPADDEAQRVLNNRSMKS